jgi:hypothetical protein
MKIVIEQVGPNYRLEVDGPRSLVDKIYPLLLSSPEASSALQEIGVTIASAKEVDGVLQLEFGFILSLSLDEDMNDRLLGALGLSSLPKNLKELIYKELKVKVDQNLKVVDICE